MDGLRQYIISVITASLICSVVIGWFTGKRGHAAIIKLLCGLFLTVTMIAPLTDLQLSDPELYFNQLSIDADAIIASGQDAAEEEKMRLAELNLEKLIRNKAADLNADVDVDITFNDHLRIPCKVKISGDVSPYCKQMLTQFIQKNLGIAKEDQLWS